MFVEHCYKTMFMYSYLCMHIGASCDDLTLSRDLASAEVHNALIQLLNNGREKKKGRRKPFVVERGADREG